MFSHRLVISNGPGNVINICLLEVINASSFDQPLQFGIIVPYQPTLRSVIHHRLRIVSSPGESKLGNEFHVLVDVSINDVSQSRINNNLELTSWWNNSCVDVRMKNCDEMTLDSKQEGEVISKQQEVNSITFIEWVERFICNRIVILIYTTRRKI